MPRKKSVKEEPKEEKKAEESSLDSSESSLEAEKIIVELGKQGMTSEKIGLELKKKNINAKKLGVKISLILKKNNLFKDADMINLQLKTENLKKHLAKNTHDYKTQLSLLEKEARIRMLKKYRKLG